MILSSSFHLPVLLQEVIVGLEIEKGKKYIDATLGGGGHTSEILEHGGIVLGVDADEEAINFVKEKFKIQNSKFKIGKELFLEQGNFRDLEEIARKHGFNKIHGILFDLGMSSYQLEKSRRGFSFERDEPLDMRMDKDGQVTAADIINKYSKEDLYEIFTKFAEELHSRSIASAIFGARALKPILTTRDLVEVIDNVLKEKYLRNRARARIFQALRIVVNNEIESLKEGLRQGWELLLRGGRLTVISYHSLEDRIVKSFYKKGEWGGLLKMVNKKPIKAKGRSARLRIAEKL